MASWMDIDGGVLEGGGQILRMSMSFSALLGISIRVFNIRAGRTQPGLRPQHLIGLRLVRDISRGKLTGDEIGSTEISFEPGRLSDGAFLADTQTAGSVSLLLQVALPCMLYGTGPAKVVLKGGTNAEMAPQIDFTSMVFKPIAERFGINFNLKIIRRGYHPRGGGEVHVITYPVQQLKPVEILDFGRIDTIFGRSFVAGVLPVKMAHDMSDAASREIKRHFKHLDIRIQSLKEQEAFGNGSGIIIVAETSTGCKLSGTALGKKGISTTAVGENAASDLLASLATEVCVDSYLQDQLVIFMTLAKGVSRIKCGPITLHTQTAIHVAEKMTNVKFKTTEIDEKQCILECEGIGLVGNFDPRIQMNPMECSIPREPGEPYH